MDYTKLDDDASAMVLLMAAGPRGVSVSDLPPQTVSAIWRLKCAGHATFRRYQCQLTADDGSLFDGGRPIYACVTSKEFLINDLLPREYLALIKNSGAVLRSVRESLGWDVEYMAMQAGISVHDVARSEYGSSSLYHDKMRAVFMRLGVLFHKDENGWEFAQTPNDALAARLAEKDDSLTDVSLAAPGKDEAVTHG